MVLIHSTSVEKALRRYREAYSWVAAWRTTVEVAHWKSLDDVRKTYPSAGGVTNNYAVVVTVFNVKGGNYRLLTVIHYRAATVYEIDLLSHGDHDKNIWKGWSV